jgi:hypothetical protein
MYHRSIDSSTPVAGSSSSGSSLAKSPTKRMAHKTNGVCLQSRKEDSFARTGVEDHSTIGTEKQFKKFLLYIIDNFIFINSKM